MKGISILLVILTIFFAGISTVQATDYASLKDDYIAKHPGQAIIPFPWEPSSSIKILPFNYEIPAVPANNLSITASRNQFESASFIISAQKNLSGITISVSNLYDAQGNSIPADAINVRTVKTWYQADDTDIWIGDHSSDLKYLTPELLLKDDSLVQVDYVNETNYLKVTINGSRQYIDISSPTSMLPANVEIQDAASLQPFSLKTNENKQIWLTVHIPNTTQSGDYYGNITIETPSDAAPVNMDIRDYYGNISLVTLSTAAPVIMNVSIKVLPFDLEPPPLEYSIYYRGTLPSSKSERQQVGINWLWKTPQQYAAELKNMKEHGIQYPTFANWKSYWDPQDPSVGLELSLREKGGLPTDHIYALTFETGNENDAASLKDLAKRVKEFKNVTLQYGYQDVYIYGIDEASVDVLQSERPAWQAVHNAGGKVFVASYEPATFDIVGDLLDVVIYGGPLDATEAAKWHSAGKRIFSYSNPQAGIENPEIYRKNYGFALWYAGYDGAMDFAYQQGYGPGNLYYGPSTWNDFDSRTSHYRDEVFTYPTSNGVIDTIQWEGWRAGVDDTRYVASLIKKSGNTTAAKVIINNSLSQADNMTTIRKNVIDQILMPQTNQSPVFTPIGPQTISAEKLLTFAVSATDPDGDNLTYSVVDLPTNASFNPTTRSFTWTPASSQVGTYNVTFRVTDGSLNDTESVSISVTIIDPVNIVAPPKLLILALPVVLIVGLVCALLFIKRNKRN